MQLGHIFKAFLSWLKKWSLFLGKRVMIQCSTSFCNFLRHDFFWKGLRHDWYNSFCLQLVQYSQAKRVRNTMHLISEDPFLNYLKCVGVGEKLHRNLLFLNRITTFICLFLASQPSLPQSKSAPLIIIKFQCSDV